MNPIYAKTKENGRNEAVTKVALCGKSERNPKIVSWKSNMKVDDVKACDKFANYTVMKKEFLFDKPVFLGYTIPALQSPHYMKITVIFGNNCLVWQSTIFFHGLWFFGFEYKNHWVNGWST